MYEKICVRFDKKTELYRINSHIRILYQQLQ